MNCTFKNSNNKKVFEKKEKKIMQRIKDFLVNDLYNPLLALPLLERIICVIIGILGGVYPVPAVTTACTGILIKIMNFNAAQSAIAIAVNLACTPLQFILLPYFADSSAYLLPASFFGAESKPSTIIVEAFKSGSMTETVKIAGSIIVAAQIPWLILTISLIVIFKMLLVKKNEEEGKRD